MVYFVIIPRIKQLGFCCTFSYYLATRNTPTGEVALELGVHRRTVRRWRASLRAKPPQCSGRDRCQLTCKPLPPSRVSPDVILELALPRPESHHEDALECRNSFLTLSNVTDGQE